MPFIRFINTKNRILLTFTTNALDARRTLTVQLAGEMHTLSAVEAQDLVDWLYSQRDMLYELAHPTPTPAQIQSDIDYVNLHRNGEPTIDDRDWLVSVPEEDEYSNLEPVLTQYKVALWPHELSPLAATREVDVLALDAPGAAITALRTNNPSAMAVIVVMSSKEQVTFWDAKLVDDNDLLYNRTETAPRLASVPFIWKESEQ